MMLKFTLAALLACALLFLGSPGPSARAETPPDQIALTLASSRDTKFAQMALFSREAATGGWNLDAGPWPALLGRNGVAWGLGVHPAQDGLQKVERDGRSPSGMFRIGLALGNEAALPEGSQGWKYHHKQPGDCWIEDPTLPNYNNYVRVDLNNPPPWYEKQRLKLDDPAYHWLLLIEHNYPDAVPGKGSAIFFHVRRGPERPTAGCTTMEKDNLEKLLRWLKPSARPHYVLLARGDYDRLWQAWNLPGPDVTAPLVQGLR